MGDVVSFAEVMSRQLAKQLGVSNAFVAKCKELGISVPQGKELFRWFLALSFQERVQVIRGVLRYVRKTRGGKTT